MGFGVCVLVVVGGSYGCVDCGYDEGRGDNL